MTDSKDVLFALAIGAIAIILAIAGIVLPESSFPETYPYGNLTDVPSTFPYGNLTGVPQSFPYANLTGYPNSFPYANLTGYPNSFPYANLTGIPNVDLMHGLGLWLPFDGVALDKSGYRYDGTVYSAVYCSGIYERALFFDGTNDYVSLPASVRSNSLSISVSINCSSVATLYRKILAWCDSGVTAYCLLDRQVGYLRFAWLSSAGNYRVYQTSNSVLSANVSYRIVVTQLGSSAPLIYVNGVPISMTLAASAGSDVLPSVSLPLSVGRLGAVDDSYFDGVIDEVRIYNRVLSQDEVLALYNLPV